MEARFVSPRAVSAHYFRPAEYVDSFAVVLAPTEIVANGADGKPEALCSAVIFGTEEALFAGRPTHVIRDTVVNVGVIYRQLARAHDQGAVLAGYIGQGERTRHGTKPWLVKELDPETHERVVKAYNALAVTAP